MVAMNFPWLLAVSGCFALCAAAENPITLEYPKSGFPRDEHGAPYVELRTENRTARAASALGLQIVLRDSAGRVVADTVHTIGPLLAAGRKEPLLGPGRTRSWRLPLPQPQGNVSLQDCTLEVRADYVRFGDGSDWGPDQLRTSQYFSGFESGARMQRQAVRELLDREGETGLRKYLAENP
jgi:hypothetical protein